MPLTSRGFPLLLTFDLDAETMWTARDPAYAQRPILMSQGAYGWKVGVWRIMDLLRRYGIRATFFIPGVVIEQRPQVIEALLKDGHEIAHHSYSHAWIVNLTPEQEREEMQRGFEAVQRATGRAPRGWRSPAAEFSPITLGLLREYGFGYSSNFFDDDSPYLLEIDGVRSDIVELPFRWVLDDAPFFQVLDRAAGTHHASTLGGAGSVAHGVRRAACRGPDDDGGDAPADHRPAVAADGAGGADPPRTRPRRRLDRPLRRSRRRPAPAPQGGDMTGTLAGRRLLVVGGAAGIGRATVTQAASEGALVAVIDRDDWAGAPAPGPVLRADVCDTAALDAAVAAAADALGGLDGLVFCAGIDLVAPLAETTDAAWQRVLDVDLTGAMRSCRAALREFPAQGGTMVLVASAAGLSPLPERSAYCAAKAGLVMFAKALALELAARGVRVNALCPGAVDTALFRASWQDAADPDAALAAIRARYALRRIAAAEEIAAAAVFLTAGASSYVTGAALAVDGGRSFH